MTGAPAVSLAPVRRARVAVGATFGLHGCLAGSWAARVPWVQHSLGLSPGALGLALLGGAAGGLLAMPVAGAAVGRLSSRRVARVALAAMAIAVALPALAPSLVTLALALLAFGAVGGLADVSMNAQAVAVERRLRRVILPGTHGLWSVGGLVGAGGGAAAAALGVPASVHLPVTAGAALVLSPLVTRGLLAEDRDVSRGPVIALPSRALLALGALCACSFFAEAAAGDWSAVYLVTETGAGPGLAGAAFALFSVTMAAGRFFGDAAVARWGAVRPVRVAAAAGACGLGLALLVPVPLLGLIGFCLLGLGVAGVVPLTFRAAGHRHHDVGAAIAGVAGVGYAAWLAAPGLIGAVAEASSLTVAFGLVAALVAVIGLNAGVLRLDR
ncbi:MAG: MFS transporter [Streptosporangiaceae bacterium]